MAIRIYAINQIARGCKVTLDPGGSTTLQYVFQSMGRQGWTVYNMGWIDDTDLAIVLVDGAKKAELIEHLKADPEYDFSKYK